MPAAAFALRLAPSILDLDRTGSGRVLARDGGYFARSGGPDGEFTFCPSPVLAATSVCTDGPLHWVTAATGLLWRERYGRWSSRFIPELAGVAEVQVLADRGRTWLLLQRRLLEVTSDGLVGGTSAQPGRLVRAHGALYLVREDGVVSFAGGRFEEVVGRSDLTAPAHYVRAVGQAADGGLHIVDDAGALYRLQEKRLTLVRAGYITIGYRHTYPDPDPDEISDPVLYAEVAADGRIASWRASHERDHRVVLVAQDAAGKESQRWKVDPPVLAVIDAPTPRLFGHFTTVPQPLFRCLTDDGVELDSKLVSPLPAVGEATRWAKTLTVGDETWSVDDRALLIDAPGAVQTRYAFAASLVGLSRDPFGQPLLLDRWGTQHVFDGARFDASACAGEGNVLDARILGGATVRLLRPRAVDDVSLHGVEPPTDAALLDGDGAPLQRQLDKGVAELALVRVPASAEKAHAALADWTRVGRSAAGVALAELLAGSDEAPGPAANAAVAAAVMRELPAAAAFYLLADAAFAAVLETPTWIVCGRADRGRVLSSLRR